MMGKHIPTLVTIVKLWQETPSVRGLRLKLLSTDGFTYLPGQWVDFHVPGLPNIGGYSICSTPKQLHEDGTIDLCVKHSMHPCAQWVHNQARVAAQVSVNVGGSFVLTPDSTSRPCLFVAGGIGITALSSMIGHLVEQQRQRFAEDASSLAQPFLLYSASVPNEFALLQQLLQWHQSGAIRMQLHTTKTHGVPPALLTANSQTQQLPSATSSASTPPPQVLQGRIGRQHIQAALQQLRATHGNGTDVVAYVCGPPSMTDDVIGILKDLGLPSSAVQTEKWW